MGRGRGRRRNRRKAPARAQSPPAIQRFEPALQGLPDELNVMIASNLTDPADSANYRLLSKRFACIGAEEHFRIFRFGNVCYHKTFKRSDALRASPIVKHVKGLAYDERLVLSAEDRNIRDVMVKHVITDLWKARAHFETVRLRGIGDMFFFKPCTVIAERCATVKLLELKFQNNLRATLCRHVALRVETHMRDFLTRLKHLEVMDLGCPDTEDRMWGGIAVGDIVSTTHTWPKLRSLHLSCFDVDAQALITNLRNNKKALRCVHFTGMGMRTGGTMSEGWAWNKVFCQIGLMNLDHGEVFLGSGATGRELCTLEGPDGERVNIVSDLKAHFPDFGEETMMPPRMVLLDSNNSIPRPEVMRGAAEEFGEEAENDEAE